jgi:hypothetical protein
MLVKTNVPKNVNIKNQGSNNGRWSGGVTSYYNNHYQLKLNRKEKLKECGNKCESCGDTEAILNASRKDGNKNNHSIDNLIMLCHKCMGSKQNSKYKTKFGNTLNELSHEFGISLSTLYNYVDVCKDKSTLKKEITKYLNNKFKRQLV